MRRSVTRDEDLDGRDSNHDAHAAARERVLVRCAVAWSVLRGARVAGCPIDPESEEALLTVERWCRGDATAVEVRTTTREAMLRAIDATTAKGSWRERVRDAVLAACEEARVTVDGYSCDRSSQMSLA